MAAEFLPGNRLTLLRSGVEYFPELEAAIREAQREIFLETYIYAGDATGRRITRALCEAASRGAAVHLLVDGFGARDMPEELARELRDSGARLLVFRPEVWRFPFRRDRLRRMHRKIAVADGRVAFVGGINIIDDMDTPRQVPPRYDYAVKIEGPLLGPIQDSAVRLWNRVALARLQHRWRVSHPVPPHLARAGSQRAALAVRDNLRHHRSVQPAARARGERGGRGPPLRRRAARAAPRRHRAGRARGGEDPLVQAAPVEAHPELDRLRAGALRDRHVRLRRAVLTEPAVTTYLRRG